MDGAVRPVGHPQDAQEPAQLAGRDLGPGAQRGHQGIPGARVPGARVAGRTGQGAFRPVPDLGEGVHQDAADVDGQPAALLVHGPVGQDVAGHAGVRPQPGLLVAQGTARRQDVPEDEAGHRPDVGGGEPQQDGALRRREQQGEGGQGAAGQHDRPDRHQGPAVGGPRPGHLTPLRRRPAQDRPAPRAGQPWAAQQSGGLLRWAQPQSWDSAPSM
ncbi:hypothetical protein [Ornithinimicrobium kibberense]|uniref:hypothetical protein n=1 Tax=Ornithinimicrobium kibberense TaxID=282060 RepID=UPI003608D191